LVQSAVAVHNESGETIAVPDSRETNEMGKLILVRHGHTSLNCPGDDERLRAWLDIPLDERGLREAAETAEKLTQYPIETIYCSDLRRARQTAEVLRRRSRSTVTATSELRPWNLGAFGGQRVRDILPFLSLLNQRPDLPAPSGESFHQFYGRFSYRLSQLLKLAEDARGCVLAVTHVRNLLAATTIIEGGNCDKVPVLGGPSTGTITIVEQIGEKWTMRRDDGWAVVQPMDLFSRKPAAAAERVELSAASSVLQ
jgi:broad specificity phosphatase PhoE